MLNFFYEEKYGFKHESVARNFKFIYSGSDEVFFDTNWHGTIIAPNAKIVLGQTHNKFLYGQFFADEIVVHQFSNIVYVPFDFNQQQEFALNWK